MEMQRKQETQDQKFQSLLQQQLQRQLQMEEHIKVQQERINMHLQLMMSQPIVSNIAAIEGVLEQPTTEQQLPLPMSAPAPRDEGKEQLLQLETDVKRYQLEKLRLEELVANMKVNYEQEIEMIETSYK